MENNIEKSCVEFSTSQMLKWMEYVADMQGVSAEKIKMLNTCSKRRNVLATIATHKRVLIFADSTYPNMLYKCWEAGYGDYEMYFGKGYEPGEMKHCKVRKHNSHYCLEQEDVQVSRQEIEEEICAMIRRNGGVIDNLSIIHEELKRKHHNFDVGNYGYKAMSKFLRSIPGLSVYANTVKLKKN